MKCLLSMLLTVTMCACLAGCGGENKGTGGGPAGTTPPAKTDLGESADPSAMFEETAKDEGKTGKKDGDAAPDAGQKKADSANGDSATKDDSSKNDAGKKEGADAGTNKTNKPPETETIEGDNPRKD